MEKTFHMLLYRAFHAQRSYLRPYLRELGLGTGQPKLRQTALAAQKSLRIILKLTLPLCRECWTPWKKVVSSRA